MIYYEPVAKETLISGLAKIGALFGLFKLAALFRIFNQNKFEKLLLRDSKEFLDVVAPKDKWVGALRRGSTSRQKAKLLTFASGGK